MEIRNKSEALQRIMENKDKMKEFGVTKVGLFGSFLRGEQKDESDVDLLVEFKKGKKTYRNYIMLTQMIEEILGRKVDLLTPESLSPYIAPHIKKEIEYVQIAG